MAKRKMEGIFEKTSKSIAKDLEEAKRRLKELSEKAALLAKRVKEEARKTARIGRLRVEIVPLVQRRDEKLKEIGRKAYQQVKKGKLSIVSLKKVALEIKNLEAQITKKEREIKEFKKR